MPAPWRGHYINLDSSPERRAAMEATLARAGLDRALPALSRGHRRGDAGRTAGCGPAEYGCFRSHHDLHRGLTAEGGFIHVLEDDAILAAAFGPAMQSVIDGGLMDAFDIVFTDSHGDERRVADPQAEGAFRPQCRAGQAAVAVDDQPGDASTSPAPRPISSIRARSTACAACWRAGLAAGPAAAARSALQRRGQRRTAEGRARVPVPVQHRHEPALDHPSAAVPRRPCRCSCATASSSKPTSLRVAAPWPRSCAAPARGRRTRAST